MNKKVRHTQKYIKRQLQPGVWRTNKLYFINRYKELVKDYGAHVNIVLKHSFYDGIRNDLEKLLILL